MLLLARVRFKSTDGDCFRRNLQRTALIVGTKHDWFSIAYRMRYRHLVPENIKPAQTLVQKLRSSQIHHRPQRCLLIDIFSVKIVKPVGGEVVQLRDIIYDALAD